jgi:thioredoxin 1
MENITAEQLKQLQSNGDLILVDYFAQWCGPCKSLMPRLALLQSGYPNIKFVSIDVDENMPHSVEAGIRSVPTVIVYKGEELINRSTGANSDSFYKDILNDL